MVVIFIMAEVKQYRCGLAGQVVTLTMGYFGLLNQNYGVVGVLCPYAHKIALGCGCRKQTDEFKKKNPNSAYTVECGLYHQKF